MWDVAMCAIYLLSCRNVGTLRVCTQRHGAVGTLRTAGAKIEMGRTKNRCELLATQ